MNKNYVMNLLKAFIALSMLAGSMPVLAQRTLTLSLQTTARHPLGQNIVYFKNQVEDISDGQIKVQLYDAAQLFKGSEIPQAVAADSVDMGLVALGEYAGTIPATELFSVAFLFPNHEILAEAAAPSSKIRQKIDSLIQATGTKVLWWQDYGAVQLLSKQKPIVMPEDMKGMKTRVLDKPTGDFITAVGGVPVKIGGSEQYIAYQRGTVDIGMTGTTAIQSRKLFEVMKNVTLTNHAQIEFLVVINNDLWDSMSDAERQWISEAALKAETKIRNNTVANNAESLDFIKKQTNMKVTTLNSNQIHAWRTATKEAIDDYINRAGSVGRTLVKQVKDIYK